MISDKCFLKMVKETIIIANVQDALDALKKEYYEGLKQFEDSGAK